MGDALFIWTAAYKTCLMRACVPRLLRGLYQLFHLCLIKHVLTVWPLTSTLVCLVTKQCLMVFGCQTFIVCPGRPNAHFQHVSGIIHFHLPWGVKLRIKARLKACPNGKCLATKHHRTLFDDQTFYRLDALFGTV